MNQHLPHPQHPAPLALEPTAYFVEGGVVRANAEWWWCRPLGELRARTSFYRVPIDMATKLCGARGYQVRLATADELLAEGFTLSALHSALRAG